MTRNDISNIISIMNRNDDRCTGSPQQVANGFYRLVEMMQLLVNEMDTDGRYAFNVIRIINLWDSNNNLCQGAAQQSANGAYRVIELLELVIKLLDKDNSKSYKTSAVIRLWNANEALCQSAPQQMANGTYRIVELLQIIVELIEPSLNSRVSRIISEMNRVDGLVSGAPQQTANGTDAIALIVEMLATAMDKESKYGYRIRSIVSLKERNNAICQGADQQSANYLYRTLELLQIMSNIYFDLVDARTAAYWAEHAAEKNALESERSDLRRQIREIEAEARAVNDGGEAAPIRTKIQNLERQRDNIGRAELNALESQRADLNSQLSAIGLFKLKERRAMKDRIGAVDAKIAGQKRDNESRKALLDMQIDPLKDDVKKIEDRVQAQKKNILSRVDPLKRRIQAIDNELTRPR